ncbi:hypothetical protein V2G26_001107 [Clonostachys chloroleuca]
MCSGATPLASSIPCLSCTRLGICCIIQLPDLLVSLLRPDSEPLDLQSSLSIRTDSAKLGGLHSMPAA